MKVEVCSMWVAAGIVAGVIIWIWISPPAY